MGSQAKTFVLCVLPCITLKVSLNFSGCRLLSKLVKRSEKDVRNHIKAKMNSDEKPDETSKKDSSSQDKNSTTETTDDHEVNPETQQQQPSCSRKAESNRIFRSFDRLLPRYCDDQKKRKAPSNSGEDILTPAKKAANSSCSGTKKEYSKLRTLVPALTEREDLSKVEIIEETIRYIDALHHQLASRGISQESEESQTQQPETNPENPSALPLKALLSGESSVSRPRRTGGATTSGSSNISPGTSSNSTASNIAATGSSSERSSTGDVKAAVENIQAMFAAYLEHQRSTSSSDDSNS